MLIADLIGDDLPRCFGASVARLVPLVIFFVILLSALDVFVVLISLLILQ
jgi:hypothetical protein